jgi:uncharacterized OsmC-like protein
VTAAFSPSANSAIKFSSCAEEIIHMNAEELRAAQAPIKEKYKSNPESAVQTMSVTGQVLPNQACRLETAAGPVDAGLHPAAGGSGDQACSGDMLLEALVACAGVTFSAVATAMEIPINQASITAEGDLDFRGTLGVSRDVPIGFSDIRLRFDVKSDAPQEKIDKLIQLTERYCVIYQTLRQPMEISASVSLNAD